VRLLAIFVASTGARLIDSGQLTTNVGEVLPLSEARLAHEMLAGKPHKPGKIVLAIDA
jgi:NADPH:quinone reductase-like Zn-dependent oxidoreductase